MALSTYAEISFVLLHLTDSPGDDVGVSRHKIRAEKATTSQIMKEFARSIRHQERFAERYTLQEKHLGLRPIEVLVHVRTTKHCEYAQRSTLTCTRAFKSKYVSAPILSKPSRAQAGGVHRGAMKPPPQAAARWPARRPSWCPRRRPPR